ncbi:probable serine/threonine-protein kinase PBL23, partial [Tanacetum coccineum]
AVSVSDHQTQPDDHQLPKIRSNNQAPPLLVVVTDVRFQNEQHLIHRGWNRVATMSIFDALAAVSRSEQLGSSDWGDGDPQKPLECDIRIKIAAGAARGLEYLHDITDPPSPTGEQTHITTNVMGTCGYCASELFRDRRHFHLMADPLLEARYPRKGLYQALAVAAMYLQEDATKQPTINLVAKALEYLCSGKNQEQPKEDQNDSSEKDEGLGGIRNKP